MDGGVDDAFDSAAEVAVDFHATGRGETWNGEDDLFAPGHGTGDFKFVPVVIFGAVVFRPLDVPDFDLEGSSGK